MNQAKPQYNSGCKDQMFRELRQEVTVLVSQLEKTRKRHIFLKAVLFPLTYILTYATALIWGNYILLFYLCYFLMGLQLVFIFLNNIHDAVHGTLFRSRRFNEWYVYLFDLIGANSYIWKLRHVRFHHNYPNVNGWDTDIEQSDLFRVFPTAPFSRMHRYQHLYMPLLYPFYLANWLLVRDFKDYFDKRRPLHKHIKIPAIEYVKLFLFKAVFLFYILVLPVVYLDIGWERVLAGFLLMLFTASIAALVVLLSPHANTESEFPLPGEKNRLPYGWMMHMLKTTNDVTGDNWFTRIFMGCFNFHVVHHLFPNINHIYYPEITQVLKKFAEKYQLPYREFSLFSSLKNHYLLLRQNSFTENIFEETM